MGDCNKLLDKLREHMGCIYISDLHFVLEPNRFRIGTRPRWLEDNTYSAEDWYAAVHYITGQAHQFSTKEEAICYLFGERSGSSEH